MEKRTLTAIFVPIAITSAVIFKTLPDQDTISEKPHQPEYASTQETSATQPFQNISNPPAPAPEKQPEHIIEAADNIADQQRNEAEIHQAIHEQLSTAQKEGRLKETLWQLLQDIASLEENFIENDAISLYAEENDIIIPLAETINEMLDVGIELDTETLENAQAIFLFSGGMNGPLRHELDRQGISSNIYEQILNEEIARNPEDTYIQEWWDIKINDPEFFPEQIDGYTHDEIAIIDMIQKLWLEGKGEIRNHPHFEKLHIQNQKREELRSRIENILQDRPDSFENTAEVNRIYL